MGDRICSGQLPYWQVNIPANERPAKCPDFLVSISEKDRSIISTPDDQYEPDTWDEVRDKIRRNRIDLFRRRPSDLRRYLAYNWQLKKDYGSVLNFMLTERLGWTQPILARGEPFEFAADMRVLRNDWPCRFSLVMGFSFVVDDLCKHESHD
jgi:hypothetical protein